MQSEKGDETSMDDKSRADLEYQYSPSRWSKRLDAEAVIEAHIAMGTTASQKARETIPYEVLRYGEGENQLIDLFGSTLPSDSPLLVYVHGGYWQDMQRSISAYLVEPLYKRGIRVAVVGYDLAPTVILDEIISEMHDLDSFLTTWAGRNNATGVWYAGHSAGAYLIGTILKKRIEDGSLHNTLPLHGMVFVSGIYDLGPLVDTYINDELKLTKAEAQHRSLREVDLTSATDTRLLIVVAENDSDEFRRQSRDFYTMLSRGNARVEFMDVTNTDHFDVVEKLNDESYELTQKIIGLITGNK